MTVLTDTHAHLYLEHFDYDRDEVMKRALSNGVSRIFLPNVDGETIKALYSLVDNYPKNCFPMMGLHPCSVKENFEEELQTAENELKNSGRKFYAVGEIGLDFYWDLTFREQQFVALERQINWAKELNLPVVLHCRNSFTETLKVIQQHHATGNLSGVFHCFSGTVEEALQVSQLDNFYMGIGGVVTYKKTTLIEVIETLDLSHFVLETDSPYLAPEPYRSSKYRNEKRNESAYILNIAQKMAEIKKVSLEEVAHITTQNAIRLFQLDR